MLPLALALAACSNTTAPVSVLPIQPVDPVVTPVDFKDLRGQSVMVLDRTEPQTAVNRLKTYLRQCKIADGQSLVFDPNGLRVVDQTGAPRLVVMIAQRGPVTGVALDGPEYTPAYQEELAQAIEGASSCAA